MMRIEGGNCVCVQGESYMDVLRRLKPFISELETEDNILIISHQATVRLVETEDNILTISLQATVRLVETEDNIHYLPPGYSQVSGD